jgi:replicative DNA helicase
VDAAEAANRALKAMDEAERLKGRIPGTTWGFPSLDNRTLGMMPGELLILAGRPGMGKTTFGLAAAVRAARSGAGVAIFSLEMSEVSLAQRAIADLAYRPDGVKVTYFDIRRGFVHDSLRSRVTKAAEEFGSLPLIIEQEAGLTVAQVAARSRQIARTLALRGHPLKVIVIDHIGLLRASSRYAGQRVNEVSEMTASLKALAKSMGVTVLALSQLNRGVESREDKRPQLSDLRDSGSIEQDADAVFGAYRAAYYLERAAKEGDPDIQSQLELCKNQFEIIILKQRNGGLGTVKLGVDVACNAIWEP